MGQAWTAAVVWEEMHANLYGDRPVKKVRTFFAHDYVYEWVAPDGKAVKSINGYKLMETSYNGNQMVNDVIRELISHRDQHPRAVWVGEYMDYDKEEYDGIDALIRFVNNGFEYTVRAAPVQDAMFDDVCIYNPAKDQYIRCSASPTDDPDNIAALALLCAVGNGLGDGDYHGTNMDLVGTWAYDELIVGKACGEDVTCKFREE